MNDVGFAQASPKAVYIHIPFCKHKCYYCDFNTYAVQGQPVTEYLHALEREMEQTVKVEPPGEIETIFVGGGTPTILLPDQMDRFLRLVRTYFPFDNETTEFTMEANPGTTDMDKLQVMKSGGVNRISFGVQSFDNGLLSRIGRIHDTDDVYRSLENAKNAGFSNLSIDLMFGLPNQTLEIMKSSLDAALALGLPHYSIYSLIVEGDTVFYQMFQRNELPLPDEDEEVAMYRLIIQRMKEAGLDQYEISNFAKPGFESRHNTIYWRNRSYYGLGAGAHGYTSGIRHANVKGIQEYIESSRKGLPIMESFRVNRKEAMEDFMMVGLRLLNGVRNDDFVAQFDTSIDDVFGETVKRLIHKGLLERLAFGYRLTEQGLFLGNDVFGAFLGGQDA